MKTKSYVVIAAVCLTIVVCGILSAIFSPGSGSKGLSVFSSSSDGNKNKEFYEYASDAVDSLNIDIEHGDVTFENGNSFMVKFVDMGHYRVKCELDGSTLVVSEEKKGWGFSLGSKPECIIIIPDNFKSVNADIILNAGEMQVNSLSAQMADIEVDAGSCEIGKLEVSEELDMNVGAGSITIDNADISNSSFECGAGEINVNGSIDGDFDVDCGMGSSCFNLDKNIDEYNFDIECGLGSVNIGGHEYSGNTDMTIDGNNASYNADINCGLGEIRINTNQN